MREEASVKEGGRRVEEEVEGEEVLCSRRASSIYLCENNGGAEKNEIGGKGEGAIPKE